MILFGTGIFLASRVSFTQAYHQYLITKYYRFEALQEEPLIQYFTPEYDRLDKIELFIANVYPETEGKIWIEIEDLEGRRIFRKGIRASKIPTGEFREYKIDKKVKAGEEYVLRISYDGKAEEIPQIMISERRKNLIETGDLYVENELSEFNMAISYYYRSR